MRAEKLLSILIYASHIFSSRHGRGASYSIQYSTEDPLLTITLVVLEEDVEGRLVLPDHVRLQHQRFRP